MKSTKVVVSKNAEKTYSGDLLVTLITINEKGTIKGPDFIQPILKTFDKFEEFTGKSGESLMIYPSLISGVVPLKSKRLLLISLGELDETANIDQIRELFRVSGGLIAKQCKKSHAKNVCIYLQPLGNIKQNVIAEYLTEGILLGDYNFSKYKKEKSAKKEYPGLKKIVFSASSQVTNIKNNLKSAINSAYSTNTARDMANEPGNGWTPSDFSRYAKRLARSNKIKCRVINKPELEKLGMGGLLAVNQGSSEEPKLIILEYAPASKTDTILLVGKGVTFDSGGISLKPAAGMMDMKYDMCGGAAVLSAMEAIAKEKPQTGVVAIIPSTDNLAGASAVKPGDIITHYGGLTSEIENTDAEGRLILADALAYGIEKFKPTCVVDLATLTGAVIVALGHHHTGVLSNNDYLVECLVKAGSACGEPLWRLPMGEEYLKQIESKVADMKNTGGKSAGTITAAAYLQKFVGDTPWAHLDIAGTAWDFTKKSYIPEGPSGVGVRTLIEFVRHWQNGKIKK